MENFTLEEVNRIREYELNSMSVIMNSLVGQLCANCAAKVANEDFVEEAGLCRGCYADQRSDEEFKWGEK